MAYTVVQLDAMIGRLETAYATGAEEITFEGHKTVYRKDMREAIRYFVGLKSDLTSSSVRVRQLLPYTNNGL